MAGKEASFQFYMAIAQRKPETRLSVFNVSSDFVKFSVFNVSIDFVKLSCHFHLISGQEVLVSFLISSLTDSSSNNVNYLIFMILCNYYRLVYC